MGMTKEEAINKLKDILEEATETDDSICYVTSGDADALKAAIQALEQQPKIGHWIEVTNGRGGHECDVCHDYAPSFQSGNEYLSAFCPNCGADMREVRENDR